MKKYLVFIVSVFLPIYVFGSPFEVRPQIDTNFTTIPLKFTSTSQTETLEWGCPVLDQVKAGSEGQALKIIENECIKEVRRAAINKTNVFEVVKISVIWPDIQIRKVSGLYHLKGTFFLEAIVLETPDNQRD